MIRRFFLHLLPLLACACSGSRTQITTTATDLEVAPLGSALLASAPIEGEQILRITMGGAAGIGEPATGPAGAEVYNGSLILAGDLAFKTGPVEIGPAVAWNLSSPRGAPDTSAKAVKYGLRMRSSPGKGRVHLGSALEFGAHHFNTTAGITETCNITVDFDGDEDSDCTYGDHSVGKVYSWVRPYATLSLFPTITFIPDLLHIYFGVNFDIAVMGYEKVATIDLERVDENHDGVLDRPKKTVSHDVDFEPVLSGITGLQLEIEGMGMLVGVHNPLLGADEGLRVDAAATFAF